MLTDSQRNEIEQLLLAERASALEALEHFDEHTQDLETRAGELSLARLHPADIGTETMEQEKKFLLASNEGRRLYRVDEALQRLYKTPDEFGMCERGGERIAFERLRVIPYARLCADCQMAQETETGSVAAAEPPTDLR